MGRIVYSPNIGFPMGDWENENIRRVAAGTNCIMAITNDGRVLQKTTDPSTAARTKYWTRIQDLAVSTVFSGLAIGLVQDGTCMISKRPLRNICDNRNFNRINNTVKSWQNIVEAAVSDAFFALSRDGRVHHVSIAPDDDYMEVDSWKNIRHIVTGMQNIVFGITGDGHVLVTGANARNKPYLLSFIQNLENICDLAVGGSESEECLVLSQDGKLYNSRSNDIVPGSYTAIKSHFWYTYALQNRLHTLDFIGRMQEDLDEFQTITATSFCFGDHSHSDPFFLAVAENMC